ncbi:hypothetical protein G6F68_011480 [Rhizopus microsporus]|nr:hypothetical protein G6F68_011480 [Rhizopus microsporus]
MWLLDHLWPGRRPLPPPVAAEPQAAPRRPWLKRPARAGRSAAVGRVVDAIVDRDHAQRERVDALQAGHVVAVLLGIGTTSVVGVDAAHTAEVMIGHMGVELVQPQVVLPAHHLQSRTGHAGGDGATAPAHRAVAAAWVDDAVRQIQQQFDRAAVAGCADASEHRRTLDDRKCHGAGGAVGDRAVGLPAAGAGCAGHDGGRAVAAGRVVGIVEGRTRPRQPPAGPGVRRSTGAGRAVVAAAGAAPGPRVGR